MTTAPPRRLYRSRTDRMVAGVAGGAAAYLQVDPALARLAFAALVLAGGAGLLIYIIGWIVIPEEPVGGALPVAPLPGESGVDAGPAETALVSAPPPPPPRAGSAVGRGARLVVGAVLVAVGVGLLLEWALPDLHHYFWPGAVIVLGLGLLVYGARR
jgi:phage shock protein C